MIHEDITISGSFQASGSFILPRIASNSLATATTGSMFYDTVNDVVKIYTGTGSTTDGYVTVGAQSEPPGPSTSTDIEYLLVAGGGGGGYGSGGGGGGAGGLLSSSISDVESGSSFTVTVGAGGSGGVDSNSTDPNDGSNSSIAASGLTTITSNGGGAGGNESGTAGQDGGSGGGGSFNRDPGSGTVGQGTAGGDGFQDGTHYAGGGGGGAGAAGGNASNSTAGLGGIGKLSHITGTGSYYAGGGSGEFQDTSDGSTQTFAGGLGGGGTGGNYRGGSSATAATDGTANTGGGGGGGTNSGTGFNGVGGTGGSGVAIFAYPTGSITATGGIKTTRADGQFVHTFKESGTLTVGGADFHTIAPSENFNIVTFTGNGGTQSITGVNFQPDLVWMKNRTDTVGHRLYDVARGDSFYLESDTNAANTGAGTAGLTSFDSDGFSVGLGNAHNGSSDNIVAWCWKAGGATGSNDDGSVTSYVSANQAAGFSIVEWTGTGAINTVGHGLSSAPELILIKDYDSSSDWQVYSSVTGNGNKLGLNSTAAASSTTRWDSTSPTSTVFTLRDIGLEGDLIAYCFHSVDGYQKIGSYSGNGTNQTITTGFKPAWVMIKATTGTSDYKSWVIFDNQRATAYNDTNLLYANKNAAEGTRGNGSGDGDVLEIITTATGFKLGDASRDNGSDEMNDASTTYLYWAISE